MAEQNNIAYYVADSFPLSYEEENSRSSSSLLNYSYYDGSLLNSNQTLDKTTLLSTLSLSNPINYIIFIIVSYLILTFILLTFSLYKQRRTEIENFYFGDTDEDIAQEKRYLAWKNLLIGKIEKGDMEPLLANGNNQEINTVTFPLHIV